MMGSIGNSRDPVSLTHDPAYQRQIQTQLHELFSENVTAKILRTASNGLFNNNPPVKYPEVVPQDGENYGRYRTRSIDFWTCGFFPGSVYSLLERAIKYPKCFKSYIENGNKLASLRDQLEALGKAWSDPIHEEAHLTNTHDLGFIIIPHMRPRWELFHDRGALETIITAAKSLHTRFDANLGVIRSWDELVWQKNIPHITGKDENFIVIIDSMCNLDLLFYAASQTGLKYLADAATAHARTLITSHLRVESRKNQEGFSGTLYSSGHVVNFDPTTGAIKERRTAQGYSTESTWSRGQAWAILGYAQTYVWTSHGIFLEVACGLAEYFLIRLQEAPDCVEVAAQDGSGRRIGRHVPLWDFDAPIEKGETPLRDTSAGTVAANGMLILAQALAGQGMYALSARYMDAAMRIVDDVLSFSFAAEKAILETAPDGKLMGVNGVPGSKTFEAILRNATVSNNANGYVKIRDHGLVYGDYYLVEFGNQLLRLGLA